MNEINRLSINRNTSSPLDSTDNVSLTQAQNLLKGISLTILGPTGQIEGPGGEIRIRLESPVIDPEDIPLNEFLQQLDGLTSIPAAPLVLAETVNQLADGSAALAQGMLADPPMDAATAADLATTQEHHAQIVERSIRDLIENSTYPNFSDFLKELVKVAQQLRESATKAKMAAIQANYNLMNDAATQMQVAALEAKSSRDKQIEAEKNEAIGQIVAGSVSLVTGIIFGAVGVGYANSAIAQFGSQIGQAMSDVIKGAVGVDAASDKFDASDFQLASDLANVAKQRLEAAAKLIEQRMAIADDLRDLAKNLRDMVLKIYQDFISAQKQALERANV